MRLLHIAATGLAASAALAAHDARTAAPGHDRPALVASQTTAPIQAQSAPAPGFEAVTLKRASPDAQGGSIGTQPGGVFRAINMPMTSLIGSAWSAPGEMVGVPDWFNRERYDLIAKIPPGLTPAQTTAMWRAFFADRFKLKAHIEAREQPTYTLVLARADGRLGPNMKKIDYDCAARSAAFLRGEKLDPPPITSAGAPACGMSMRGGQTGGTVVTSGGMTMARLAQSVWRAAGRVIVDQTGLTGDYEFTLTFSRPAGPASDGEPPTIFTALQEQLGLKLEPTRGPVEVVVIDAAERPTLD